MDAYRIDDEYSQANPRRSRWIEAGDDIRNYGGLPQYRYRVLARTENPHWITCQLIGHDGNLCGKKIRRKVWAFGVDPEKESVAALPETGLPQG